MLIPIQLKKLISSEQCRGKHVTRHYYSYVM